MKYLLVLVIALAALVAADEDWQPVMDKAMFKKIYEDCRKEHGLTEEQSKMVLHGEYPDVKEVHEYVLCSAKKMGIFTEDKGYNLDRLMTQLGTMFDGHEKLRDMVTGCVDSNEQNSTPAEWAYRGKVCFMKTKIGEAIRNSLKLEE